MPELSGPVADDPAERYLGRNWDSLLDDRSVLAEAEDRVAEWGWAPIEITWNQPWPLCLEAGGERPRDRRIQPPTRWWDYAGTLCGWDSAGEFVLGRVYSLYNSGRRFGLQLVATDDVWLRGINGEKVRVHYRELDVHSPDKPRRMNLTVQLFEGDRLTEARTFSDPRTWDPESQDSWIASGRRFEYDERGYLRVIRKDDGAIEVKSDEHGQPLVLTYRSDGKEPVVLYRHAAAGRVKRALNRLADELPDWIVQWARRQTIPEGTFALKIIYGEWLDSALPPALAFITFPEAHRPAAVVPDAGDTYALWSADGSCFDPAPAEIVDDTELREACEMACTHWASTDDYDGPRHLMTKVAKRVRDDPWIRAQAPNAPLAVLAIDLESEDLTQNLRASVPKPHQQALIKQFRSA